MCTQEPLAKTRPDEPDVNNPHPERRPRRKRSPETDNPEPDPAATAQLRKRLEILKICLTRSFAAKSR